MTRGREAMAVAVSLCLLIGGPVARQIPAGAAPPPSLGVAVDQPAPDFSLTLLSGERIRLAHFRGKVVVLNFWASW